MVRVRKRHGGCGYAGAAVLALERGYGACRLEVPVPKKKITGDEIRCLNAHLLMQLTVSSFEA